MTKTRAITVGLYLVDYARYNSAQVRDVLSVACKLKTIPSVQPGEHPIAPMTLRISEQVADQIKDLAKQADMSILLYTANVLRRGN